MTETRYPALRRYVTETPWALHPSTLLLLREVLGRRLDGDRLTAEELAEITAAAPKRNAAPSQGAIAVLPLWGMLSPHQVSDLSSGPTTALDSWGAQFDALVNDPSIATIVLDVDSPGGSVDLVPEVAAKVRAANARKDIIAVANTRAASAAYWIAAQAGQLVVTPSGAVGSIGVYAAHEDVSRQLEEDGVTVTLVSAGDHKTDGNPFEPLSDDALATIQANVNAYYGMFVGDVAKGRGVDVSLVEKKFGQGKMMLAGDAVRAGMADGVASLEDVLARLQSGKAATNRRAARSAEFAPALAAGSADSGRLDLAAAAAQELAAAVGALTDLNSATSKPTLIGQAVAAAESLWGKPDAGFHKNSGGTAAGSAAPGGDNHRKKEQTMGLTIEELVARREDIAVRMTELQEAADGGLMDEEATAEFAQLDEEVTTIDSALEADKAARDRLAQIHATKPESVVRVTSQPDKGGIHSNVDTRGNLPDNLHDLEAYRGFAGTVDELLKSQKEGARRVAENVRFVGAPDQERAHEHVEDVLGGDEKAQFARRVIVCGDPAYDRAFGKALMRGRDSLSLEEDRLIKAAITEGGIGSETPVPITIDPTVTLTSSGATNPIRSLARVVTISGLTWRGLTSGGITAQYETEGAQVPDNSPTFGGSDVNVVRADAYVPFSMEVDMDWGALRSELATEMADAKDVLEASKFLTGSGTNEPQGIITGVTATTASIVKTATTATFAIGDPDIASNALPPRFDPEAQWIAAKAVWAKIEALYQSLGNADPFSFAYQGIPQAANGQVNRVFKGYPINNASGMDTAFSTSGKNIMLLGDFLRGMVIVDRIGMNVELVPIVFGANQRPTGERGIFAYWRNTSVVKVPNAFRVLQVL